MIEHLAYALCISTDQDHTACKTRDDIGQWRKILALAFAAQNDDHAAFRTQALQGGDGGTHVGALAVVKKFHLVDDRDRLDTVRLTPVFAQPIQHGPQGATSAAGQRQSCKRIDRVVATPNSQGVGRHQALNVQFFRCVLAAASCFIGFQGAHQPGHAVRDFDAEVARALRHVGTKQHTSALYRFLQLHAHGLGPHGHDLRVFAVEHHQGLRAKNSGFRSGIGVHAAMPVQVVLRDVQHCGGGGLKALAAVELKAGQLQHPHLGQRLGHGVLHSGWYGQRQFSPCLVVFAGHRGIWVNHIVQRLILRLR